MRTTIHKLYLVVQALVILAGAAAATKIIYTTYNNYDPSTDDSARICALQTIDRDMPIKLVSSLSYKWTQYVSAYVGHKVNLPAVIAEANKISKACADYMTIEVSKETGDIAIFLVSKGEYRPAVDFEQVLYALSFVFIATALTSIFLFIIRKWIGMVFRPLQT